MRIKFAIIANLLFFVMLASSVQSQSFITSYSSFTYWLPVVLAGVTLAFAITAVYYMVGALLGNQKVKAAAISQFLQVFGTVVILVIIIIVLNYFGQVITLPQLLPPSNIQTLCTQLSGSSIDFLNSSKSIPGFSGQLMDEPPKALCNGIIDNASLGKGGITTNLDYGLASTYLIEDNLTNQSVTEMTDLSDWENLVYFLRGYLVTYTECSPFTCVIPLPNPPETLGDWDEAIKIQFRYFSGYVQGRLITPVIATEMNLMFYLYMMQLVTILLMLLLWPYFLAAGLFLRAFSYTQRIGGLLIAIVVVSLILYPTIVMFQYNTLNNVQNLQSTGTTGTPGYPGMALCGKSTAFSGGAIGSGLAGVYCYTDFDSLQTTYIFRTIIPPGFSWSNNPSIPACPAGHALSASQNNGGGCYVKKSLNFYVFPKLSDIPNLYSYWPGDNIIPTEIGLSLHDVLPFGVPGSSGGIETLFSFFDSFASGNYNKGLPNTFYTFTGGPQYTVGPEPIIETYIAMEELYGYLAIPGYIIPILDLMMLVSAVTGLSSLLGGETSLLGLSRFL